MLEETMRFAVQHYSQEHMRDLVLAAVWNALLFVSVLVGLSSVSRQYSQLNLIMASLNVQESASDFRTLQGRNAAFTLCGIPMTSSRIKECAFFFLGTSVLSMWALASAYPLGVDTELVSAFISFEEPPLKSRQVHTNKWWTLAPRIPVSYALGSEVHAVWVTIDMKYKVR